MKYIKENILPVVYGFAGASAVMLIFEFTNSKFFPFPEGMNTRDAEAVRAFTASLPNSAYILVWLGWFFGSIACTYIVHKVVTEKKRANKLTITAISLLTIFGLLNNLMLGTATWFTLVGLLTFFSGWFVAKRLFKI